MLKGVRRFYDNKVIEYFENPPNVGRLNKNDKNVGTCKLKSNSRKCFLWGFIKILSKNRGRW